MRAITYGSKKAPQQAKKLGGNKALISVRLRRGWTLERAFKTPPIRRKWTTRKEYEQSPHRKLVMRNYRRLNSSALNKKRRAWRNVKEGHMPREVWWVVKNDREVWDAMHNGMKARDPEGFKALLKRKGDEVDRSQISNKCADCEALFEYTDRCGRNPTICKSCWGERYMKKLAKNKESLLFNPNKMV